MVELRKVSKIAAGVLTAGVGILALTVVASRVKRNEDDAGDPSGGGVEDVAPVSPIVPDGEESVPLPEEPVEVPEPDVARLDPRRQPAAPQPIPGTMPPPVSQTLPNGRRAYQRDPNGEITASERAAIVAASLRRRGYERRPDGRIVKIDAPRSYQSARGGSRRSQYHTRAAPTTPSARESYYAAADSYRLKRIEAARRAAAQANARRQREASARAPARPTYRGPPAKTSFRRSSGTVRYPTLTTVKVRADGSVSRSKVPLRRPPPTRRTPPPTTRTRATRYSRYTRPRATSTSTFDRRRQTARVAAAAASGRRQARTPIRRAVKPTRQTTSKTILAAYRAYRGRR